MANLDVGSIVEAELSFGRHPAIVLSAQKEIASSGKVFVVAISANTTISLPEDLIEVPRGLGMKKKCYVQCKETELVPIDKVTPNGRKAWGIFLEQVHKQVRTAAGRAKKSTQS